ncbi:MAG: antibiotic biosynthesis monooxygenase [Deltaproteobacteria bacterium]|nr:antibiotic biosynthesis monooxygenase [Deltaproteobacteria bacterium]
MIAVQGHVDWPVDLCDEMRPLLAALAERTRQDEGCIAYWWAEDLDHPGRFRFFEAWEDQTSFDAHRSADYEHDFMNTQIPRAIGAGAMEFTVSGVKNLDSEVPADAEGAAG